MPDDLTSIDVTHLDALAKLESDHRALRALSEKAAWRRDKELEVYARVMADYGARMATIVEHAQAMRRAVGDDFKTLDALYQRHKEALNQARVQLQECEFRHEIGEFTREEFERCQQAAERTITERDGEFEAVGKLRERYLALLPAELVVAAVPPPAPPSPPSVAVVATQPVPIVVPVAPVVAPTPAVAPVVASSPVVVAAVAPVLPPIPMSPAPAASVAPAPPTAPRVVSAPEPTVALPRVAPAPVVVDDDDEEVDEPTMMAGDRTLFMRPPTEAAFKMPPRGQDGDSESFGTIVVSPAILVEDRGGIPGTTHRLGPLTAIGRDPENQIVVPVKEVSRKHALVAISDGGYVIKDLGSPNGTTVNGKPITEHRLKEGDKITVGGKVFVFKAP